MNKRIHLYAATLGFALTATSAVYANLRREVGRQSQAGVQALKTEAAAKKADKNKQGTPEELHLVVDAMLAADGERLDVTPAITAPSGAVPAVAYANDAAAYQNKIIEALKNNTNNAALIANGADGIKVITDAAATAVPTDAQSKALYDAIVTQVNGKADAATIRGAVTVANLNTDGVKKAGISEAVLQGIVADVTAHGAAAAVGAAPGVGGDVHADARAAAAAFGVTWNGTAWVVSRPLSFSTVKGTSDVLHFHQGDFSDSAGFFVGLDEHGDYSKVSDQNNAYALSRVDLTPNDYGVVNPRVTPIAPAKVKLNNVDNKANPIHGKGLTHLLLGGQDRPTVAVQGDSSHLYVVSNITNGSTVLQNNDAIQSAAGGDVAGKIFDIAATRKETKYDNANSSNLLFAAVAEKEDLHAADVTKTGIAVVKVEANNLTPLDATATNVAGNKAQRLKLTQGAGAHLAVTADATWAPPVAGVNQGDINLWWDDRYKQLFGTVAGLKPAAGNQANVAFGLFSAKQDGDAIKINPMQDLNADRIKSDTQTDVAASVFGASGKDGVADTGAQINLYRPRTMHTSTDKDYLLVTGGVATKDYEASKAWVNALPLVPPAAGAVVKLAKATDAKTSLVAYNKAETPHVDRIKASEDVVDEYTPYIVGRHPSYLAPVGGDQVVAAQSIDAGKVKQVQINTKLAKDSILKGEAGKETILNQAHFQASGGGGSVTLAAGTPIGEGVKIDNGSYVDNAFQFSKDTVFGVATTFRENANLVQGSLEVTKGALGLKKYSILARDSVIGGGTTLANDQTFALGGANTTFGDGSILAQNSTLAAGSVINADNTAKLTIPTGSVIKFDAAQTNMIGVNSFNAFTDIALKAEHAKGVELHKAQDNAAYTAVNALQLAALQFAVDSAFKAQTFFHNNNLGLADDKVDSQVTLRGLATKTVADTALPNTNDSGKEQLVRLSEGISADFANDPALGRGFAVAHAITNEAKGRQTAERVLDEVMINKNPNMSFVPGISAGVKDVLFAIGEQASSMGISYAEVLNSSLPNDGAGKFVKGVVAFANTKLEGDEHEKRALFKQGVVEAYPPAPPPLGAAWLAAVVRYDERPSSGFFGTGIGFSASGALTEEQHSNLLLDEFDAKNPKDGSDLANAMDDVYGAGVVAFNNNPTRVGVLKAMTAKAVISFDGKDDELLMKLFDAVAQNNDKNNSEMALAAVQKYCSPDGAAPAVDSAKGITKAMADLTFTAGGPGVPTLPALAYATAIKAGLTNLQDPAMYNDSGAQVLYAVAQKVIDNGAVKDLPAAAFTKLSERSEAARPAPADAGAMAGRSIIEFRPQEDLALVKDSMIGQGSVLRGVMPQDTWELNNGLQLVPNTYLPAYTLFKKSADTTYKNNNLPMAAAAHAGASADAPWGGEWVLGNVQLDRDATKVQSMLKLSTATDGVKIVPDRVIKSNIAVGVDAWKKYIVTIPQDTILPAGTKFTAGGALNIENEFKQVDATGAWNIAGNGLNFAGAGDKTIEQPVKVPGGGDFTLPDGLTITLPEYPTHLLHDFVIPAGTRIKATNAVDVHNKIVKAGGGGDAFVKADGTEALKLEKDDVFILPENAKINAGGANKLFKLENLTIDNDPLYTPGIITGNIRPTGKFARAYKLPVDIKLKQGFIQTFWPGTTFARDVEIKPGVKAGVEGYIVQDDLQSFGGLLKKDGMLAPNSQIGGAVTVDAVNDLVLGKDWQLNQNLILPEGTILHLPVGFSHDLSTVFQTFKAMTKTWEDTALDFTGVGALAVDNEETAPVGGFKINGLNYTLPNGVTITIPKAKEIVGTWVQKAPVAQPLTADVTINFDKKGTAQVTKHSLLKAGSLLVTGFGVDEQKKIVADFDSEKLVTKAGGFAITNTDGMVRVLNRDLALGVHGTDNTVVNVTVGAHDDLVLGRDLKVAAGSVVGVAPGSKLTSNTQFGVLGGAKSIVTLGADLPLDGGKETIRENSVIKQGSTIALGTEIEGASQLKVVDAHLQLNDVATNPHGKVLAVHDTSVVDANHTGALRGQDSTIELTPARLHALNIPAGRSWTIGAGQQVTIGGDTILIFDAAGQLGAGTKIGADSTIVTEASPYAVSATDMQVIGDTVYIGLEGDRNAENGIEAGVFKSTALFNEEGVIRGWTPWQRVGANTDATAFFGYSETTGNLVYLTSPEGSAFIDKATDSLVNPATTVKMTKWGSGDDDQHNGLSLASALAKHFASSDNANPGVAALFDFDPDTRCFKTVNRRYQDPVFSMMIATGYERVSLIQTGALQDETFMPTKKFDASAVFNFGPKQGLKDLGSITCAEITRNATAGAQNWIFVGGSQGLAVLVDNTGNGFKAGLSKLDKAGFPKPEHKFITLKVGASAAAFAVGAGNAAGGDPRPITDVRKIVADEATGYVYVVTKDKLFRIKPDAGKFTGAAAGVLTYGALDANDVVLLADVANSKYEAGGDGVLLTGKAVDGVSNAEFADLVVIKSADNTKKTAVLVATTAGVVVSNDIPNNFAGDDAALKTNNMWSPCNSKYDKAGIKINARDWAGDADKKAASVGAALRFMPINLHSGGRMAVNGHEHTFEGNIHVVATNNDGTQLREYRLNASKGAVAGITEATSNDAKKKALPYFAKLGDMDPSLLTELDATMFVQAMDDGVFASGLPELVSPTMVDDAIKAAAAGESELALGNQYYYSLGIPQLTTVSDSASGATYAPTISGVSVNE